MERAVVHQRERPRAAVNGTALAGAAVVTHFAVHEREFGAVVDRAAERGAAAVDEIQVPQFHPSAINLEVARRVVPAERDAIGDRAKVFDLRERMVRAARATDGIADEAVPRRRSRQRHEHDLVAIRPDGSAGARKDGSEREAVIRAEDFPVERIPHRGSIGRGDGEVTQ